MTVKLAKIDIERLQTCDKKLQGVVLAVATKRRIRVIEGARKLERQKELLKLKKTKTMDSKHLITEERKTSAAVDLAPIKDDGSIDWNDTAAFHSLAKDMLEEAEKQKVKIRWGGDWNMNGKTDDEKFRDLVHFELI